MNTFRHKATQRLFAALAWVVFVFGVIVIITGFLTGSASPTSAEEPADDPQIEADPQVDGDDGPGDGDDTEPDGDDEATENDREPTGDEDADIDKPVTADDIEALTEKLDSVKARGPPDGDDDLEALAEEVAAKLAEDDDAEPEDDEAQPQQPPEEESDVVKLGDMEHDTPLWQRLMSFFGIFALLFVAWLMSNNRRKVNWRLVSVGVGLQIAFGIFIFFIPGGEFVFAVATEAVAKLLDFTDDGSQFIFESFVTQEWEPGLINFAFAVLPTIIFFSSLMTILYYLGVMQKLVELFATVMQKTMNLSGAESTSAAANIFVGQTEAPLVIKPFVEDMTESELMVVMTGGFATVAGGVLAIYVGMLDATFPDIAGHLIAASVMSAPAALVIAKIMYPETATPETMGQLDVNTIQEDVNVLGAASRGAAEGLKLALNVGAMLLAFIALIALINYLIGLPSLLYNKSLLSELAEFYTFHGLIVPEGCDPAIVEDEMVKSCVEKMQDGATVAAASFEAAGMSQQAAIEQAAAFGASTEPTALDAAHLQAAGHTDAAVVTAETQVIVASTPDGWVAPMITMQDIFGWVFWPFAFLMGVPIEDCHTIGRLLGEKMVINELVAYASLQQILLDPDVVLQERSVIIATYALCGFANFGSIGIQLGGIGGIAPSRMDDLAKIALRAMIGGTLAAFMTATVAGIMV